MSEFDRKWKTDEKNLTDPLRWRKASRVRIDSDLFHENVPDAWIDLVFAVMALAPQHVFQVLTKRAARVREYVTALTDERLELAMDSLPLSDAQAHEIIKVATTTILPNVWLGVTAEDQPRADERIPDLLATPAAKRFVSIEPMLGPVDLAPWVAPVEAHCMVHHHPDNAQSSAALQSLVRAAARELAPRLDWVIAGGESGAKARPSHPAWARSLRDQCASAGTAFFWKQWGEWIQHYPTHGGDLGGDLRRGMVRHVCADRENDGHFRKGDVYMTRVGKRRAGHLLDGREHREFPA